MVMLVFDNNDCELFPRTYSIKSYRRRRTISLSKIIKYTAYAAIFIFFLGITLLYVTNLI